MNLRRLRLGLLTVTSVAQRGFFIPYRYADTIVDQQPEYAEVAISFSSHEPAFGRTLELITQLSDRLTAFSGPPPSPRWTQDWFPRSDGAAAYAMVRHHKPSRIIEVGSGHSTRFMVRAITDGDFSCDFTAIDPAPRAAIDALPVRLIRKTVQDVDGDVFAQLAAGDMLFIDSSHLLMPGTDVDVLFSRVLPRLPAGVFVHIHDVFLPDAYPKSWQWRGYNEQLGVAMLLQGNRFAPIWSSHYAVTRMKDQIANSVIATLPLPDGALESSLWLRKL